MPWRYLSTTSKVLSCVDNEVYQSIFCKYYCLEVNTHTHKHLIARLKYKLFMPKSPILKAVKVHVNKPDDLRTFISWTTQPIQAWEKVESSKRSALTKAQDSQANGYSLKGHFPYLGVAPLNSHQTSESKSFSLSNTHK